jgi:DNA recombination protein RmuC
MDALFAPLLLLGGLAAGAAAAWWLRGRELAREREHTAAFAAAERAAHEERLDALLTLRGEFEQTVKGLAADALDGSQKSFLQLAEQVFARHKEGAEQTLEARQQQIAALLGPINNSLEEYRKGLGEIEKARAEAYGGLSREMASLVQMQADASAQTRKLVNALQAAPKTRGRWGEHQLRNVMELSGMSPYCDFTVEQTVASDDGRLRPDVIIRLPGDRRIVVDAKTSMAAYLDAVEATDEELRESHLAHHARQLRTHMKLLAGKQYWEALPFTPDFVAMFVPGENFYAAAIERDPALFEDSINAKVLIVTPTTLIALAKAIAVGWRQEALAENARHIGELGRELYRRLATMNEHAGRVGAGLEAAVKHYNNFVGSLEGRVLVQARKFNELSLEGAQTPLPDLRPVETQVRTLRPDADGGARAAEIIPLIAPAAVGERGQPAD